MSKLLITGFDAFAHYQKNPSWEAVKALPEKIADLELYKLKLPNIYGLAGKMLLEYAQQVQPNFILMVGMDSNCAKIHLDTVAINLRDGLIEDNLGHKPWNEPIIEGAPTAYFATLPVHELVRTLQKMHLPVHIGYSVGAFICNDIFYLAANHFYGSKTQIGFLHVPILPEMVWDDSLALPLEETIKILEQIVQQIANLDT